MSSRESLKLFKLVLHQQTLKCLIAAENLFTCWIFVLFWISKPLNKYTCHFHSTKFHLSHENGALHVSKPIKSSECQKHYSLSASKAHRSNWKCFNAIENKDGEWKKTWRIEEDFISTVQVSLKMSVRVTAVNMFKLMHNAIFMNNIWNGWVLCISSS